MPGQVARDWAKRAPYLRVLHYCEHAERGPAPSLDELMHGIGDLADTVYQHRRATFIFALATSLRFRRVEAQDFTPLALTMATGDGTQMHFPFADDVMLRNGRLIVSFPESDAMQQTCCMPKPSMVLHVQHGAVCFYGNGRRRYPPTFESTPSR